MQNQFSRTELLIGKAGVEKLKNAKVAVYGIGGVGSYTVEGLARAGVGHLVLNLYGRETDYKLRVDKGLGAVKFNGSEMSDGSAHGDGKNEIKIDGGVGAIDITTRDR